MAHLLRLYSPATHPPPLESQIPSRPQKKKQQKPCFDIRGGARLASKVHRRWACGFTLFTSRFLVRDDPSGVAVCFILFSISLLFVSSFMEKRRIRRRRGRGGELRGGVFPGPHYLKLLPSMSTEMEGGCVCMCVCMRVHTGYA